MHLSCTILPETIRDPHVHVQPKHKDVTLVLLHAKFSYQRGRRGILTHLATGAGRNCKKETMLARIAP
ncbi:hypothetical protein Mapa_016008 [Marchantia paleacea]|nr:hypothetical protein Mapa_016008 [Marchantia paleacea]